MDAMCIVCGESWDQDTAQNGYLEKWEFALFRKGAGCPSCEGVPTGYVPEGIGQVEFGDECCMERIEAIDPSNRPKWEKPKSEVVWTCSGCGVVVQRDANGDLEYDVPRDAPAYRWHHSHPFGSSWAPEPPEEPEHVFGDKKAHDHQKQPVCEFCLKECIHCDEPVSSTIQTGDVYDPGWCASPEGNGDLWCVECIGRRCECGDHEDNCECSEEEEEED